MKLSILLLAIVVSASSFGAISNSAKQKLNRYMGGVASQVQLGTLIDQGGDYDLAKDGPQAAKVIVATYDYSVHGGASTANINIGTVPDNAIITRSWVDVVTAPQGSGSSVKISTESDSDVLVSTEVASMTGIVAGVSTGTASNMKKMSAARSIAVRIGGALGFTAGKFKVFVEYVMSE